MRGKADFHVSTLGDPGGPAVFPGEGQLEAGV